MSVRDFIIQHPDATFNMMTEYGFVYLTSEQAKEVLEGGSVMGYSGFTETGIETSSEDLLTQTVKAPYFENGVWHLLSYVDDKSL